MFALVLALMLWGLWCVFGFMGFGLRVPGVQHLAGRWRMTVFLQPCAGVQGFKGHCTTESTSQASRLNRLQNSKASPRTPEPDFSGTLRTP